ncbi:hypothetical protein ACWEK5_41115 [Rhodococcus koreensis]
MQSSGLEGLHRPGRQVDDAAAVESDNGRHQRSRVGADRSLRATVRVLGRGFG